MAPMVAERPEPARREPVWLDKAAVLKRMKWSEADFEVVSGLQDPVAFPVPGKRTRYGSFHLELIWRDTQVDDWAARLREHVAVLQRLLPAKR